MKLYSHSTKHPSVFRAQLCKCITSRHSYRCCQCWMPQLRIMLAETLTRPLTEVIDLWILKGKITIRNVRKCNRVKGSSSLVFVTFDIDQKHKGKDESRSLVVFIYICAILHENRKHFSDTLLWFFHSFDARNNFSSMFVTCLKASNKCCRLHIQFLVNMHLHMPM